MKPGPAGLWKEYTLAKPQVGRVLGSGSESSLANASIQDLVGTRRAGTPRPAVSVRCCHMPDSRKIRARKESPDFY